MQAHRTKATRPAIIESLTDRLKLGEAFGIDPIVSEPETCAIFDLSRSTLRREVERGNFPPPVRVGKSRIGFRASELRAKAAQLPRAA